MKVELPVSDFLVQDLPRPGAAALAVILLAVLGLVLCTGSPAAGVNENDVEAGPQTAPAPIYSACVQSVSGEYVREGVRYRFRTYGIQGSDGFVANDRAGGEFVLTLRAPVRDDRFQNGRCYAFHGLPPRPETGPIPVSVVERDTPAEEQLILEYINDGRNFDAAWALMSNIHKLVIEFQRGTPIVSDTDRAAIRDLDNRYWQGLAQAWSRETVCDTGRYWRLEMIFLNPRSPFPEPLDRFRFPVTMGFQATAARLIPRPLRDDEIRTRELMRQAAQRIRDEVLALKPRYPQLADLDTGTIALDFSRDYLPILGYRRGFTGRSVNKDNERDETITDWCLLELGFQFENYLERSPQGPDYFRSYPLQNLYGLGWRIRSSDPELTAAIRGICDRALEPLAKFEVELQTR